MTDRDIALAIAFIQENFRNPTLGVPQIAQHLGVSERYVYKIFSDRGDRPYDILLKLRIAEGRRLLTDVTNDGLSIAQIAVRSGYSGPAQFSRAIKRSTGKTPTEFRLRRPARRR